MKLDPGIHIVMHSVLFLKPGVTEVVSELCRLLDISLDSNGHFLKGYFIIKTIPTLSLTSLVNILTP